MLCSTTGSISSIKFLVDNVFVVREHWRGKSFAMIFQSDSLSLCIPKVAFDVDVCRFLNSRFRKTRGFMVSNKSESHMFLRNGGFG